MQIILAQQQEVPPVTTGVSGKTVMVFNGSGSYTT